MEALATGRLQRVDRPLKVIYNGIEGGITTGGFEPGRKALIPAAADAYGIACANSNAYACALGRHKFHYLALLRTLGIPTPPAWHYREDVGWAAGLRPTDGVKVIAKSTYESWSVGVTERSVFVVDGDCEERVRAIAASIGQPVTVQGFVTGQEVAVPVLADPRRHTTPPVEAVLAKAPDDPEAVMTVDDNLSAGAVSYRRFGACSVLEDSLRELTVDVFDLLQLDAFARIDFRVDADDRPWVIDVGVSPGVSRGSSAYASLGELGFNHAEFLRLVIAMTLFSRRLL